MEHIKEIIPIISAILGIVITATSLIIPLVKSVRSKKRLASVNQLATILQKLIMDAETFTNFSGAEKKEYVMTKVNRYALENNIQYDEESVSNKIEELIELSKNVNKRNSKSFAEMDSNITSIRI